MSASATWTCARKGCGKTEVGRRRIIKPKERPLPPAKWLRLTEAEYCCSQVCFRAEFQARERAKS